MLITRTFFFSLFRKPFYTQVTCHKKLVTHICSLCLVLFRFLTLYKQDIWSCFLYLYLGTVTSSRCCFMVNFSENFLLTLVCTYTHAVLENKLKVHLIFTNFCFQWLATIFIEFQRCRNSTSGRTHTKLNFQVSFFFLLLFFVQFFCSICLP